MFMMTTVTHDAAKNDVKRQRIFDYFKIKACTHTAQTDGDDYTKIDITSRNYDDISLFNDV